MGKRKQKWQPWQLALVGSGLSLGVYGGMILGLAYLVIAGLVPESAVVMLLALGSCISVLLGGLCFGRRLPFGVMGGCLSVFVCFWLALLLLAWGCYGGVCWTMTGGVLVASSLAGAILAGVLSRRHKGRRISKQFG